MNQKVLKTLEYNKIITQLTSYAASTPGKLLCQNLLPMSDYHEIVQAQTETSDALTRVRMKGSLSLSGVRDVRDSLKRLEIGSALGIPELLSISSLLTVAARAKAYGQHEESEEFPDDSLDSMFRSLEPVTSVNNEIKRCILSEDEISDNASPGLHKVRRSMHGINDRIHTQLNSILNSCRSYLQDAVITMRDGRYCLPVKAEYKSQVNGMVHDQSSTGSTLFIEPMAVIQLNNELRTLEIQEQKEIEAVLADLSGQLMPYTEELAIDLQILSQLDFIFAKAALSRHFKCSEPKFNTEGRIHIKDGRHPLLDPQKVVPITVWLGTDFDLLMVTGPNTGGKTVSLKTVGLFTLMGQAGLHIPAFEGSELAVFEEVFADIGDEQSIEQSLSTFSAHMTNIVHILNQADSHSLCLFDELCSGTDPTEGAALAIAILNFLHNMKCRTMATTHYSELKIYALSTPGVENACCEFDVATLRPTYRLLIGIPGKSNAFAISKKLGLPDYIIDDAKTHLESEDETFEDVISRLEENRVTIEKERAEIESYKAEIARLKSGLEKKEERFDERKDKMIRKANEEAQQILREAKETADRTIKNINKLAASSGIDTKALEAERTKLRDSLKKVEGGLSLKQETKKPHKAINPKTLKLGDGVRVLSMNLNGTVSSLPDAQGNVFVQMGILRSKVNISDLELLQENSVSGPGLESRKKGSGSSNIKMSKSFGISPEINVLGMTVDEAVAQLDKYLDDAYIAHLPQVRIVHGKGTGALRAGIHKHLKRLKYVKEFHLGGFGEGDAGVTIVVFK
ncbi:endonuclease MutS2 [Clostridium sp. AF27-2AA]|jgi:DNA mismatch repair protein MutS2|uniref:endonuclease MutS2 n=1 Tax=Clostridium sp. AF27-2AA TaxID=2292206 RepID=UPI000E49F764|nr:endonuclease MutS2 [Clostridium sp. AF27-2AA]RHQ33737.1 endonuclease MutS2 [Clostridium sp. AF27-2AA]